MLTTFDLSLIATKERRDLTVLAEMELQFGLSITRKNPCIGIEPTGR